MKKHFLRLATILFATAVMTVSASAANNNNDCNQTSQQNTILKYLLNNQSGNLDCNQLLIDLCENNFNFNIQDWFGNSNCDNNTDPCKNGSCETDPCADGSCETDPCQNGNCDTDPCADGSCEPDPKPPVVTPPVTEPEIPEIPEVPGEPDPEPEVPSITDPSISAYEAEVITLVNEIRRSNGLSALAANPRLCEVARIKSQDMRDNGYFSHTSPVYGSPFDMMKTFGISYRTAGENIAYGYSTPAAVVEGWMNSEGHRANILNASYTEIGVGYVSSGNYWTQMFIS